MKIFKSEPIREAIIEIQNALIRYGFEIEEENILTIEINMQNLSIDKVTFSYHYHWWEMKTDWIDTDGTHYYQFKIIQQ